ncbi:G-protein coupled receptor 183-like [Heptranchias perlo]|uniref:G-protein coupled receptor 183-like n=1 Tax=Heptranchias perlo TaxID=212740 RepID=UPI00355A61D3
MATFVGWDATVTESWLEINSTIQAGNVTLGPSMESTFEASFMRQLFFLPIINSPILLSGIIGNSIALWHIVRLKKVSSPTDVLLLDLIIIDLFVILSSTIEIVQCTLQYSSVKFLGDLCFILSIINLYGIPPFMTCIAIDQYIAVVHPIRSHSWRRPRYYVGLSIATWLIVFSLSLVHFFFTKGTLKDPLSCKALVSLWSGRPVLHLCSEVVTFFVPIVILLACYALTAKKMIEVGAGKESMELMKKKVLKTIWAILALLLFCFAPFHIIELSFVLKNLLSPEYKISMWLKKDEDQASESYVISAILHPGTAAISWAHWFPQVSEKKLTLSESMR